MPSTFAYNYTNGEKIAIDIHWRGGWQGSKPDVVKQIITLITQLRYYGYENIYINLYPTGVGT